MFRVFLQRCNFLKTFERNQLSSNFCIFVGAPIAGVTVASDRAFACVMAALHAFAGVWMLGGTLAALPSTLWLPQ